MEQDAPRLDFREMRARYAARRESISLWRPRGVSSLGEGDAQRPLHVLAPGGVGDGHDLAVVDKV